MLSLFEKLGSGSSLTPYVKWCNELRYSKYCRDILAVFICDIEDILHVVMRVVMTTNITVMLCLYA